MLGVFPKQGPKTEGVYHRSAEDRAPPTCVCLDTWAPVLRVGGRLSHYCAYFLVQTPYKMMFKSNLWSELTNAIYTAQALHCLSKIPSSRPDLLNLFKETEPIFAS